MTIKSTLGHIRTRKRKIGRKDRIIQSISGYFKVSKITLGSGKWYLKPIYHSARALALTDSAVVCPARYL
jgi:hypothetical protein